MLKVKPGQHLSEKARNLLLERYGPAYFSEDVEIVQKEPEAPKPPVTQPKGDATVEDLRTVADALGIAVDKRWGVSRLNKEIKKAREDLANKLNAD